jgi:phenylpropionate dioxygenase-like ring-hydroxylating dioxygenase large terminal subunit
MSEADWWHPVAEAAALGAAPLAVTLLGEDLVLWRNGTGAVFAFTDRCPHRGTRLSLGRVCDGRLECAYHGWQFSGAGDCVRIPALPEFEPPASHRATAFAVTLAYGLVWVKRGASDANASVTASAAPPPFDAEADPRLRKLLVGPYDVATSAPRIVENFLDLAHFGFVHEGVLGDRAHTEVPPYQLAVNDNGLLATGCMAWQPQANRRASGGAWVAYEYAVPAPYTAVLTKVPEQQGGQRESIALFVCPIETERSRVWFRMAGADFESSDDELRAFQHRIFLQDQPVLESQRPKRLPLSGGEVHCASDRSAVAYRRWLHQMKIGFGVI